MSEDWKKQAREILNSKAKAKLEEEHREKKKSRIALEENRLKAIEWHKERYRCHICGRSSEVRSERTETYQDESWDNYYVPGDLKRCGTCRNWVCENCCVQHSAVGLFCLRCANQEIFDYWDFFETLRMSKRERELFKYHGQHGRRDDYYSPEEFLRRLRNREIRIYSSSDPWYRKLLDWLKYDLFK